MADTSAPRPGGDPLAVRCCACLAPPGEPCVGTTSNLPRERPHRLRPLAAAPRLAHCPDCEGSGWQPQSYRMANPVMTVCPVCDARMGVACTEGGRVRDDLHEVRRRAARAGLEPCGTCDAVGWVPAGEPEPTAPRPLNAPARGVHVIPGSVPEGVVPPSTSMTPPTAPRPDVPDEMRPQDVPEELIDIAMTGANPGCREDAAFYLANVLPAITADLDAHERRAREKALRDLDAGAVTTEDLTAAGLHPSHVVDLRVDGWTIQHPLTCRVDLFACPVNRAAERALTGPPHEFGRFECGVEDGEFWIGETR